MPKESDLHPHVPAERADLFTAADGWSTEDEYLDLLYGLIRVHKPTLVLETGTFIGLGTQRIAEALRDNGFGRVVGLEVNSEAAEQAEHRLSDAGLTNWSIVRQDSIEYLSRTERREPVDFAFLDSHLPTRADELALLLERKLLSPGALVLIHDTSRLRTTPDGQRDPGSLEFWKKLEKLRDYGDYPGRVVMDFPLSRGMLLIRLP